MYSLSSLPLLFPWNRTWNFHDVNAPFERISFLHLRVFSSLFPFSLSFFFSPLFNATTKRSHSNTKVRRKQPSLPRRRSAKLTAFHECIGVSAFAYKYFLQLFRGHRDENARSSGKSSDRSFRGMEWIGGRYSHSKEFAGKMTNV